LYTVFRYPVNGLALTDDTPPVQALVYHSLLQKLSEASEDLFRIK
jgi:hypothetical protein